MSYAVLWSEEEGPVHAGKLELLDHRLVLDGANGNSMRLSLALDDIASMRIGRTRAERLQGRPVLVLEDRAGVRLRVATISGIGALHELADAVGARVRATDVVASV